MAVVAFPIDGAGKMLEVGFANEVTSLANSANPHMERISGLLLRRPLTVIVAVLAIGDVAAFEPVT